MREKAVEDSRFGLIEIPEPEHAYFHNGAAASLDEVVNFYNDRFQMGLTDEEKAELVAFLNSL